MHDLLLDNQRAIYTVVFFAAVTIVALWEGVAPRRDAACALKTRWPNNIVVWAIDVAITYLVFPMAAVGVSMVVEAKGLGLLRVADAPFWIAALVGLLAVDLGRYAHHYLLHRIPFLWRVHRIHHADHDYDFTVGLRFHPIEGLFTTGFIFVVIALVGPPPIVVVASELLVAASSVIAHANARTPRWVERYLRLVLVTPDMHRVHHSVDYREHNSNYAAVFSVWDRLFGTYVPEPAAGHEGMIIGLPDLRDPACLKLRWMLLAPFTPRLGKMPQGGPDPSLDLTTWNGRRLAAARAQITRRPL